MAHECSVTVELLGPGAEITDRGDAGQVRQTLEIMKREVESEFLKFNSFSYQLNIAICDAMNQ